MGKEQINSRVINAVGVLLNTHKELTQTAIAKMLGTTTRVKSRAVVTAEHCSAFTYLPDFQ